MNFKTLQKSFMKLWAKRGLRASQREPAPYRDWVFVVGFFVLGLVVSVVLSAYLFWGVHISEDSGQGAQKTGAQTLDQKKLESVIEMLDTKEKAFQNLKTSEIKTVDPSL